ncbi:hypothetical protein [Sphingomonas sp. SUN039]|uniref:hypothetical protein n=1 Tax=Sphingomonas sp. SUN039 TaxID=2937787 RepID=UPI0021647630|nr:hypothetical protein [Sphingomonas sp. SUN039]UVO53043.1 hypothetical protein M0209_02510 [Sphingomonas sp. SUN039]
MTVAKWEYWSVANMMVSAHGENVHAAVALRLAEAKVSGHESDIIVWNEVAKRLPEIIAERSAAQGDAG